MPSLKKQNLKRNYTNDCTYKAERIMGLENKLMVAGVGGRMGGRDS